MDQGFPELLKSARQKAGFTTRRLKDELCDRGVEASITYINFVEKKRVKPGYDFSRAVGRVTDIGAEQALRAAFLYRVNWAVEMEREKLLVLAEESGLSKKAVERITAFDIPRF